MMDCACCGLAIGRESGQHTEDEEFVCSECGATCVVFIEDEAFGGEPYFGSWKCKHGVDGDEPCDQCDAEEGP